MAAPRLPDFDAVHEAVKKFEVDKVLASIDLLRQNAQDALRDMEYEYIDVSNAIQFLEDKRDHFSALISGDQAAANELAAKHNMPNPLGEFQTYVFNVGITQALVVGEENRDHPFYVGSTRMLGALKRYQLAERVASYYRLKCDEVDNPPLNSQMSRFFSCGGHKEVEQDKLAAAEALFNVLTNSQRVLTLSRHRETLALSGRLNGLYWQSGYPSQVDEFATTAAAAGAGAGEVA